MDLNGIEIVLSCAVSGEIINHRGKEMHTSVSLTGKTNLLCYLLVDKFQQQ